jgi:6-phosphofructokinase
VVSEGAKYPAIVLKDKLNAMKLDVDLRVTVLGHVQRGGSPSAWDRLIAARFGVAAVERLHQGESGVMVGLQGSRVVNVRLEELSNKKREPDLEYYRMARMLAK